MTDITELAQLRSELSNPANGSKDHLRKLALLLVEALEKAQDTITEMDNRIRKQNRHVCELFDDNTALRQRIAELESRTVTVKLPNQTQFDDPLSAYEAIEKCKEALTAQGIKWEAE
ncbi:hypothetical protein V9Z78_15090 [Klebsiella pneumoniae]|nr:MULTISPECIES: hypothetical protein [Klebsiella]MDU4210264.1 hypothetical protein [Finegoldia magna]ANK21429.1 hypothetical protein WM47_10245 [Klebsiella pneumoniae]MCW9194841.1 hypothetical protein [Klebsiella pneumoniae]MCY0552210.1 hypothetical protein [Klebsiella pneumoniae]MDG0514868.1 hypothetical protein [Klebsiella pneumoniae]